MIGNTSMIVKAFEVRDRATFIPVLAILLGSQNAEEEYLLMRCGYRSFGVYSVMMTRLAGDGRACVDPQSWGDRTMQAIHFYLEENFVKHQSGDVLDVEFILGEKKHPKLSERLTT